MNGVHDMGGMQDMGPIDHESDEPVFHARWEGRVLAMVRALRARGGVWNLDAFRHGLELLPPADYLRMSYYERWFAWMVGKLQSAGDVTESEIVTGHPGAGAPRATPYVTAAAVPILILSRSPVRCREGAEPRFREGQPVRARNMHPVGHTRLPRYVRAKTGVVLQDRGIFVFPDSRAHMLGDRPQHLYSVRFSARELFGEQASSRHEWHGL
jgi:nitrile hydratase